MSEHPPTEAELAAEVCESWPEPEKVPDAKQPFGMWYWLKREEPTLTN